MNNLGFPGWRPLGALLSVLMLAACAAPAGVPVAANAADEDEGFVHFQSARDFGSLEGMDDNDLVCRIEAKKGSHLKTEQCYTVGSIRAYRRQLAARGDLPGLRARQGSLQTGGELSGGL